MAYRRSISSFGLLMHSDCSSALNSKRFELGVDGRPKLRREYVPVLTNNRLRPKRQLRFKLRQLQQPEKMVWEGHRTPPANRLVRWLLALRHSITNTCIVNRQSPSCGKFK